MSTPEPGVARRSATNTPGASAPAFDPQKAGKVGQVVEIFGIELLGAHFDRKQEGPLPESAEPDTRPTFTLNVDWKRSDDQSMIGCGITFATDFGEQDAPYNVVARFRLTYSVPPGTALTDDEIENFAHWNAVFNAWPYWREYLSSTINRAGLPRFAVPVMKLPLVGAGLPGAVAQPPTT